MRRRQFLTAAGTATAGLIAGCSARTGGSVVREVTEETVPASEVDTVTVMNDIGDVTVRGEETDEVIVRVLKRSTNGQAGLDDIDVSVASDGGDLRVRTEIADDANWFSRSSPTTDATVTVPVGEDGPEIRSIDSNLGDVTLRDVRGDTSIDTRLGRVDVRRVAGRPSISSNLGDLIVRNTDGVGTVRTELGDVSVDLLAVPSQSEIRTELGDIAVSVGSEAAFDLEVTSQGSISSQLSLSDSRSSSNRLVGTYNGGGPLVRVTTELGDVSLRPSDG